MAAPLPVTPVPAPKNTLGATSAPSTGSSTNQTNSFNSQLEAAHRKDSETGLNPSSQDNSRGAEDTIASSQVEGRGENVAVRDSSGKNSSTGNLVTDRGTHIGGKEGSTTSITDDATQSQIPQQGLLQFDYQLQISHSLTLSKSITPDAQSGSPQVSQTAATLFRLLVTNGNGATENAASPPTAPQLSADGSVSAQAPQAGSSALQLRNNYHAGSNDPLLGRLQQIIENSSETGTVTISSYQGKTSLAASAVSPATGLSPTEKASIQQNPQPHLRQNIQQQYLDAKLGLQNQAESNNSQTREQTGQEQSQHQGLSSSTPGLTPNSDPATTGVNQTGSFFTALNQDIQSSSSIETVRPVQPSPTTIHDIEVIRQITERFQFLQRPVDTRLQIRLHPAELGQLRIGIHVHEGAVRANIVAQSHMVHEILERNMPKLRSVLEEQGLKVDDIAVTTDSESVGEYTPFEQQFYDDRESRSDFSAQHEVPKTSLSFATGNGTLDELNELNLQA